MRASRSSESGTSLKTRSILKTDHIQLSEGGQSRNSGNSTDPKRTLSGQTPNMLVLPSIVGHERTYARSAASRSVASSRPSTKFLGQHGRRSSVASSSIGDYASEPESLTSTLVHVLVSSLCFQRWLIHRQRRDRKRHGCTNQHYINQHIVYNVAIQQTQSPLVYPLVLPCPTYQSFPAVLPPVYPSVITALPSISEEEL
jgi:hypothetical protein